MAALLKWKQPRALRASEWREAGSLMRQMLCFSVKWGILLTALAVYLVSRIDPDSTWRMAPRLALGTLVFPLWFYIMVRFMELVPESYTIGDKVIAQWGAQPRSFLWRQIEAFRITSRDDLPGIRFFEFRVKGLKRWNRWGFDPSEVDESRLRAILDEHLPGKCWDNVSG